MADIRTTVSASGLLPQVAAKPARSEAVRAAQRAFFDAALAGAGTVSAAQPKVIASNAAPPLSVATQQPGRVLRPGSLLDIKV